MIRLDDFDSIRHSGYERTQRKILASEGRLAEGKEKIAETYLKPMKYDRFDLEAYIANHLRNVKEKLF